MGPETIAPCACNKRRAAENPSQVDDVMSNKKLAKHLLDTSGGQGTVAATFQGCDTTSLAATRSPHHHHRPAQHHARRVHPVPLNTHPRPSAATQLHSPPAYSPSPALAALPRQHGVHDRHPTRAYAATLGTQKRRLLTAHTVILNSIKQTTRGDVCNPWPTLVHG